MCRWHLKIQGTCINELFIIGCDHISELCAKQFGRNVNKWNAKFPAIAVACQTRRELQCKVIYKKINTVYHAANRRQRHLS